LKEIKAVIFDLDGTLVNLPINWDEVREKVRKLLKTSHPLKPLGLSVYEITRNNPELRERAFKLIESEELKAALQAKYDSRLHEMIVQLKKAGLKIGLVTLQGLKTAILVLEKLGIKNLFDVIVTRERSVYRLEQLKIALRELKVKPEETIFVGDTIWDREAGETLGCKILIIGDTISNILEVKGKIKKIS